MKFSIAGRLYIGFLVSFILAAVVGLITYLSFRRQVAEVSGVNYTYQVITQAQYINKLLVDMETARRGFRSTNEQRFLEPYFSASKLVNPEIDKLEKIVSGNPGQVARVNRVGDHVRELLQYWNGLTTDYTGVSKETMIRITDQEKDQMDRLRRELEEIIGEENRLLQLRQRATADSINNVTYQVVTGTILVQLIILFLIRTVFVEFRSRRRAEEQLKENNTRLEIANKEAVERNWMLTGVSYVNENIRGVNKLQPLANRSLKALIDYLGLSAGAVYFYREDEQALTLLASHAVLGEVRQTYSPEVGLAGKAIEQKELLHIKDIPSDHWLIASDSGTKRPVELALIPLFFSNKLNGVIELATVNDFSYQSLELLRTVSANIGIAINAANANEKVMQLLAEVQHQKEEVEFREEELRQTNEELTRQTENLQASEEELKVQEEELRQTNAELEEKNEAVEIARQALLIKAQELEVTSKYKSEFLANMSHELRTPLNSILILAKLMADNKQGNLTEKQLEFSSIIHKSGSDLLQLINDILDLSKIEAGKVEFNLEPVPIKQIMSDISQQFEFQAEEKGLKFATIVDKGTPATLFTDKLRLEQVIKNLLSNAIKFTPKGGEVELHFRMANKEQLQYLKDSDKVIAIEVRDTGIGIPKDKQKIVFEAFQQVDGSTSRKYGGTGLGLSISKELIKRLGGDITLQSEEDKGSVFTLYVPASRTEKRIVIPQKEHTEMTVPDLSKGIREQDTVPDDRKQLHLGDKLMLIVEDDPKFAMIVRDFARSKGYKTLVALQGDEGLYYAMKYKPGAIILDLMLPVIDGGSILKMLKGNDKLKHIPVHIISALDGGRHEHNDAIAFLRKPVSDLELEEAFDLIASHISSQVKNVLVLSGTALKNNSLQKVIQVRRFDMNCDFAANANEAVAMLGKTKYDCLIADVGKNLKEGIALLHQLQEDIRKDEIPVIIYLDKDLSARDELQLKKISDTVIRQSSLSEDRLMDELELFLYKLQETEKQDLPGKRMVRIDNDTILKGKKILLVDDDMRNVFALSTLLEQQEIEVVTANDGREALEQLKMDKRFDLVLMDIMMPEMDGYEAMRRIRKDMRMDKIPIIALTAKAMPGDQQKCIEAGASDYIAKPIDSDRLFSLMKVWLSQ